MVKIKISVIRRFSPEEVFGQEMKTPTGKVITVCSSFEEGQEFIVEDLNKPDNFCGWAWYDIYKDISTLTFGGEHSWTDPNVMYTSCTDGMRPVCFKLERLNS